MVNKTSLRFVKTQSKESAEKLRKLGYQEITQAGSDCYTFINNGKFVFDVSDKIFYTNMLYG